MEIARPREAEMKKAETKKGRYGLNHDEQAKLAAEEFAKKRTQRLLQVREQEKEFAKLNRQEYEERLSQHRKKLYMELLQEWDKQHQREVQDLQDAHQRALHAASAAQDQAEEAAEAARQAEAAADARSAIQADLAAKRFAEAAQQARQERDILARERDRRVAWLQQARSAEQARAAEQVAKQQKAQRRAAEKARERLRRRGRDSEYDFRFTRFHETGLELQPVLDLPGGVPSLADSAELQARKAAREAERNKAAEERGRAALHRLRMERAAKQLTAQLEAELQARRSAAAASAAASPLVAALQPHRELEQRQWQGSERQMNGTHPDFTAAQPQLAPDLAALPRATWPQPTPWATQAQSTQHILNLLPAAAAGGIIVRARRADKTTQCPEGVDRQTQTESPEPRRQPTSKVPRPHQLRQHPVSTQPASPTDSANAAGAERSFAHTEAVPPARHRLHREGMPLSGTGLACSGAAAADMIAQQAAGGPSQAAALAAHSAASELAVPGSPVGGGQRVNAGTVRSVELPEACAMPPAPEDMVRTQPGELSDSCCSSRAGSVVGFAVQPPPQHTLQNAAAAERRPVHSAAAERQSTAVRGESKPRTQQNSGGAGAVRPQTGRPPDQANEQIGDLEMEASLAAGSPADASCTISVVARAGETGVLDQVAAEKGPSGAEKAENGAKPQDGTADTIGRLKALEALQQSQGGNLSGTFLAEAAAELEALCAESLINAPEDLPTSDPSAGMRLRQGHVGKGSAPKALGRPLPQGRPVKTALQRAEELLARLTEDGGLWDLPASSSEPSQPISKEQAFGGANGSMQFSKDDEQRLMEELEAISRQYGHILPSSDTSTAAHFQARRQGPMKSLELLAERLQGAISDTVSKTEGMLSNAQATLPAPSSRAGATLSRTDPKGASTEEGSCSKGDGASGAWGLQASAGTRGNAKGQLGSRGSVASSSCGSLLGALRLASFAEERLPGRDPALGAEVLDNFSCSDDDAASDGSGLPFDAISLGSTAPGSPVAGGKGDSDRWLSDTESLDPNEEDIDTETKL